MASGFLEGLGEAWLVCTVVRLITIAVLVIAVVVAAWTLGGQA